MGKIKETGNPIVDRIKLQAKLKGKSITFICDKLGVGKAYLSNVVGGSGIIPDERLEVFAQELNTTVEYLKTGKENPPAISDEGIDPLDARINELLACSDDNVKRSMIAFLESYQSRQ
ncbi:helix-turn-helix domain-containing protein [Oscillibacter ruminantium]|uniref:helix-turn-helix domain-containing protein n=1 Tax=Oscillibacter ruminantium TaxID=1263547 RepID=UPI0033226E4B